MLRVYSAELVSRPVGEAGGVCIVPIGGALARGGGRRAPGGAGGGGMKVRPVPGAVKLGASSSRRLLGATTTARPL
jgi:hypothetical protein